MHGCCPRADRERRHEDDDRLEVLIEVGRRTESEDDPDAARDPASEADPEFLGEPGRSVATVAPSGPIIAMATTMSEIPIGSLKPDSPSSTVRARVSPRWSRRTA